MLSVAISTYRKKDLTFKCTVLEKLAKSGVYDSLKVKIGSVCYCILIFLTKFQIQFY